MSTAYSSAKQQYIGNGATTEWGFDFPIQKHSELKVYLRRSGQAQVLLEEGVDYSFVTENTIAFPIKTGEAKLQAADVLALQRESVFESEYNFSNQQRLEPEEVMNADDNLERQIQELKRDSEAAIKVLPTSNVDPNTFFEHVERVYGSVDNIDTVANDKANVDTVATNIADVNTVADDIESVNTVANNIESVVIDVTNIADINTVAGNISNVNTVSGSIDSVNTVAPSIGSVNAVAPKVAEVSTVSANITDVNTVAESITNVNRVGQSIANVNTVAGVSDEVDQVAMIAEQTKKVGDNISDVMTVASVSEQVKTVAANATAVKDIGDNIDTILQAPENERKANIWAEGNDSQVESLGGTHSAKVWASIAKSVAHVDSASETKQGIARIATADEAVAGTNDLTIITPLKAKYIADEYTGKVVQLGFNGVLENNVLTFTPDQDTYEIKAGYEYEVDLLFPAAGVLPDNTPMVIQNGTDTIVIVNVKDADASSAMTYGNMKQMCRYDAEIGWRWIFNARYAVTDTGVKVLVMPSAVIDDSRYVTTDTAQNITAGKNFINSATSTTTDAHTGMSICLKNSESDITANTQNEDGSVDFKYQGIRFVDKNNEETGFIYNAPDGVGGSFTRVGTSAKVDGQYVNSFIEIEVDANGKGHVYLPDVDTDATVSGKQAATVDYVDGVIDTHINNAYSYGMSQYYKGDMTNNSWLKSAGQWNSGTVYTGMYNWLVEQLNARIETFYLWYSTTDASNALFITKTNTLTAGTAIYGYIPTTKAGEITAVSGNDVTVRNDLEETTVTLSIDVANPTLNSAYLYDTSKMNVLSSFELDNWTIPTNTSDYDFVINTTDQTFRLPLKAELDTVPSGWNLYYYCGDTLQNAQLINVARIEESLTTKTDSVQAAQASMPSSKHVKLTVGASGTTYTAPANGWFYACCGATGAGASVNAYANNLGFMYSNLPSGSAYKLTVPIRSGDVLHLSYNNMDWTSYEPYGLWFLYAEGDQ